MKKVDPITKATSSFMPLALELAPADLALFITSRPRPAHSKDLASVGTSAAAVKAEYKNLECPSNSSSPALLGDPSPPISPAEQLLDSGSDSSVSNFTPSDPPEYASLDSTGPLLEGSADGGGEGGREVPLEYASLASNATLLDGRVDGEAAGGSGAALGREGEHESPGSMGDGGRNDGVISLPEPPAEDAGAAPGVEPDAEVVGARGGDPAAGSVAGEAEVTPQEVLVKYRKRVEELRAVKQANPDMVAFKEMRQEVKERVIGALPGIPPGFTVCGKGELAVLGIHCAICAGIYSKKGFPAFAVVLSGGYADDDDTGVEFWYTGMGGQDKRGIQVMDQQWTTSGNAALQLSYETGKPVRVVRKQFPIPRGARRDPKCSKPNYVYEGLYSIAEAKKEVGTHGCFICRFRFVAMPGASTVSTKVEAVVKNFRKVKLASQPARRTTAPKAKNRMVREGLVGQKRKAHSAWASCLLMQDFSRGAESRSIPVYGEESDAALIPKPDVFTYIRSSNLKPGFAENIAEWGRQGFEWQDSCGVAAMGGQFMLDGAQLMETLEWGHFECGPSCTGPACEASRVIDEGISLPLEIFRTENSGWGLRCSCDIAIGTFICEYAGEIIADSEAAKRSQEYLFNLDHFILLEGSEDCIPLENRPFHPRLPSDLTELWELGKDINLAIDGQYSGNVGRFINHSCDGNLVVQPTFGPGSSGLHYRVAIFALKRIPAFEELTYGYGWAPQKDSTSEVWCTCKSAICQGRLL